jgi:hypothetical protein
MDMSLLTASYVEPKKFSLFARLGAWLALRPTAHQKRATQDMRALSSYLQRDVGFELLIHSERRP